MSGGGRSGVPNMVVMAGGGVADRHRRQQEAGGEQRRQDARHGFIPGLAISRPTQPLSSFITLGERSGKSSLIRPSPKISAQRA